MAPARTLRFDTTFVASPTARTYRHSYTASLPLGRSGKARLPVEIEWSTTQADGCAQVTAVRVYQLGRADSAATLRAQARRDVRCRPGQLPAGTRPAAPNDPSTYSGFVLLRLTGVSRAARTFAETSLTLNGLGYHDTLGSRASAPPATAVQTAR